MMSLFKSSKGAGVEMKRVWRPKTKVIGTDLGYTQGKLAAYGLKDPIIVPSLAEKETRVSQGLMDTADGFRVDLKSLGDVYLVGKRGRFDLNPLRFDGKSEPSDYAKYFALLALYLEQVGYRDIDLQVTGIPTEQYEEYSSVLKEKMEGTFNFGFEGRNYEVHINKTWVLPQCMGAYYDYILDVRGHIREEALEDASGRVLAINIGGKTTEVGIIHDGGYTQESYTIKTAVTDVQKELSRILRNRRRINSLNPMELDTILRTGHLPYGRQENVEEEISEAIDIVFNRILDEMYSYEITTAFSMFNGVLLSGGGTNLFIPYFEDMLEQEGVSLLVSKDPEMANAEGFRKFGLMKLRQMNKLEEEEVEVAVNPTK